MKISDVRPIVRSSLKEDVGSGDITTNCLIPPGHKSRAIIFSKEDAVLCGMGLAMEAFRQLDPGIKISVKFKDGDRIVKGAVLASLSGRTRAILTGERVGLNFLSYLSAVATRTRSFCEAVKPYSARILDTRKTTPGFRRVERYAVVCGGGVNHRFNLSDMVLVKDNHRMIFYKDELLADTVRRLRSLTHKWVVVEVDNLKEFKDVIKARPDVILLDNMSLSDMKKAVSWNNDLRHFGHKPLLEASGGITIKNVGRVAATGVDRISIGALTHSRKAIDMSLEILDE